MSVLTSGPVIFLLILPTLALAAETGSSPLGLNPLGGNRLMQMMLGLTLVLAAIAGIAWLMRRYTSLRGGESTIKLIGVLPLGTRERMVLVELGKIRVLVGITPGRLQTLHVFNAPTPNEPVTPITAPQSTPQRECDE